MRPRESSLNGDCDGENREMAFRAPESGAYSIGYVRSVKNECQRGCSSK